MPRHWLIALFIAAPITLLFERMAHYVVRAQLFMKMLDGGLTNEQVTTQYGALTTMMWLMPLLGGLLAIALSPRIVALIGAGLAALAYLLLAFMPVDALVPVFVLWAIALGLFKPGFYAFLGLQMRDQPETRWGALFVLLLIAVNIGAMVGVQLPNLWREALSSSLFDQIDTAQIASRQSVSMMLSATAVLAMLVLSAPKPMPTGPAAIGPPMARPPMLTPPMPMPQPMAQPGQTGGSNEVGILALLAAVLPAHLLLGLAQEYGTRTVRTEDFESVSRLYGFNGAALIGACIISLLILLVVGNQVRMIVTATGTALLLGAVSILPLIVAPSYATALIQQFLAAPVELVMYGLLLGRASVGTRPRLAGLMVALWLVVTSMVYWISGKLVELAPVAAIIGCALICITIGAAFLALRTRIETTLFPQPPPGHP